MADASSDWATRPFPRPSSSSSEGDHVSSQSADPANSAHLAQRDLASAFDSLHLQQICPSRSFDECAARASSLDIEPSDQHAGAVEPTKEPLQLMDLPLDILKCIIKEVRGVLNLTWTSMFREADSNGNLRSHIRMTSQRLH